MRLLILAALPEELACFERHFSNTTTERQTGSLAYLQASWHSAEIFLALCGIGKVNAALTTALMIHTLQPDYVVNIGSAGGIADRVEIGDIVIADSIAYHDVDVSSFGYAYGQIPGMPATFESHPYPSTLPCFPSIQLHQGLILSGDRFVEGAARRAWLQTHFPQAAAVEMESGAIAQVCHRLGKPFFVFRSISDHANQTAAVDFKTHVAHSSEHLLQLVLALAKTFMRDDNKT